MFAQAHIWLFAQIRKMRGVASLVENLHNANIKNRCHTKAHLLLKHVIIKYQLPSKINTEE